MLLRMLPTGMILFFYNFQTLSPPCTCTQEPRWSAHNWSEARELGSPSTCRAKQGPAIQGWRQCSRGQDLQVISGDEMRGDLPRFMPELKQSIILQSPPALPLLRTISMLQSSQAKHFCHCERVMVDM